ncbi:hypothetical protein JCM8097_006621 [Rhodosporidiobolus ruineniae]
MLDRLPPEILIIILDLVVPPPYAFSSVDFLRTHPDLAEHVHILRRERRVVYRDPLLEDEAILPNLLELRLLCGNPDTNCEFWYLVHLTLAGVTLTCHLTDVPDAFRLFRPAAFPSLRAVYTTTTDEMTGKLVDFTSFPRLDMVQVNLIDHNLFTARLASSRSTSLLATFCLDQAPLLDSLTLSVGPFAHFQLDWNPVQALTWGRVSRGFAEDGVATLVRFICSAPQGQIQSFSLPFMLHPSAPTTPTRARYRDEILGALEKRGVEVVWRWEAREQEDDIAVNREFWAYARRNRAVEVVGA